MTAALLLCVSCKPTTNKPTDNQAGNGAEVAVAVGAAETANVIYSVTGGEDDLLLFGVTAVYTDASGHEVRENITELPWAKTIEGVKVPFEANLSLNLAKKSDFPEKVSYRVGLHSNISYKTSAGRGKDSYSHNTMTIGKNKVEAYQDSTIVKLKPNIEKIEPKQ